MTAVFTIVGANLAGGRAAEALRAGGFDGRIVLIGAEPHPPYERPPLSKELLTGARSPQQTYVRSPGEWADLEVELLLDTAVTGLLPGEQSVELADGRRVRSDKVLLCTGARVRRLTVPGASLDGVHYLRTIEEALALRSRLVDGVRLVVVGAGFIGCEVAAAARTMGCQVTLVEPAAHPLELALGRELGALYSQIHRDQGVDLRTGVSVVEIAGDRVARAVVTSAGDRIAADTVVVGIGAVPATDLAEAAGIRVGNGIAVDELCRTSMENVYAAGDVAEHPNSLLGERLRLEHWRNAQDQGVAAARAMLGGREAYISVPWFWSDQYDVNLQVAGHPRVTDTVVWRGEPGGRDCTAFFLRDDVLVGAAGLNRGREVRAAMKLIERKAIVAPAVLRDSAADLRAVLTAA